MPLIASLSTISLTPSNSESASKNMALPISLVPFTPRPRPWYKKIRYVSHNEISEMYREYVDPNFTWKNFTLEEQVKVIVAPRSNNELDAEKLKKEFPKLLSIKDLFIKCKGGKEQDEGNLT
ncbi:Bifunctional dTDP-4-dehydrorhamnose 3,5-epimerase/dTDP-4-dehydrorhamnose reductase [Spatholobus suberectus]|nr:Bifunctional dTDP-4-dehydrorhamnose 3,5-epimerase/dTDP-4-dehydrorhamnose reductase [Spatholobus suberectus]